jgi:L-amino acid N-acyltransferase YncA
VVDSVDPIVGIDYQRGGSRGHADRPLGSGGVEIRAVTEADWPSIWPFLSVVLAAGETYTYPRDITEAQARDAWLLAPPWHVVVAEEAGRILGIAKYGPNWPGGGSHVANASFVVDPAAGGRGVGRGLAEHVLAAARSRGFRAMQFNAVVETNTGAVALWQSLGFGILATIPEAFDHPTAGLVGLHIMHRFL